MSPDPLHTTSHMLLSDLHAQETIRKKITVCEEKLTLFLPPLITQNPATLEQNSYGLNACKGGISQFATETQSSRNKSGIGRMGPFMVGSYPCSMDVE